ncbi:MAG: AEC family transporter [Lachnospiraceae bacterium]|nr:AEC family transporter [Lachnospiraceae bacterium]
MELFINSLGSVAIVFLLTALGYYCAARGWLNAEGKRFINKFLINIGIPVMCISELTSKIDRSEIIAFLPLILAGFASLLLTLLLAAIVQKAFLRMKKERIGIFLLMCSTTNALFVGLAMCTQIFGDECTPYVMMFYLVNTIVIQLVCQPIVRKYGTVEGEKPFRLSDMLKTPTVLGVLTGCALVALNVKLPHVLAQTAMYVARTITPFALLLTGYIIYEIGLKNLRINRDQLFVLLFRFVICPAIGAGVCALAGISGMIRNVLTVELAMPVLSMAVVYASSYGADEQFAAQGAALTTLGCFIVIPVWILILG